MVVVAVFRFGLIAGSRSFVVVGLIAHGLQTVADPLQPPRHVACGEGGSRPRCLHMSRQGSVHAGRPLSMVPVGWPDSGRRSELRQR